jgi:hypothetical protein
VTGAEGGSAGASRRLALCLLLALAAQAFVPTWAFAEAAAADDADPGTAPEPEGSAETQTIAVLDLGAPPVLRNLARALAVAIAEEARGLGHETRDSREVGAVVGPERMEAAADCGVDVRCLTAALRGFEADRVLAGTLDRGRTAYEVRLVYVDLSSGRVVGTLNRDILIASRRLERDVRDAVPDILAGVAEQDGVLVVATDVPGTRVLLNQALVGETPPHVRVAVQPGRHHLRIVAPDHLPYDRYVEVVAGEETVLEPRLFLEPGKSPPSLVAEAPPEEEAPGGGLQTPPSALVSLALGALAVGGGAYFGVQAREIERAAVDRSGDGFLDVTRTDALLGKRHARNANILYGLAGASLIAASLLTVLPFGADAPPAAAGAEMSLRLGPDSAILTLGGPLP